MNTRKIIVNADDFGMSQSVNSAILTSFENGWISSTTIMANMPAFEQACEIAHKNKLLNNIGIHLNLTEGMALSEEIKSFPTLCNSDGLLQMKRSKGFRLSKDEYGAVYSELNAQVNRCFDAGLTPTHMDSHHHSHHAWKVFDIAIKLAKNYSIKALRPSFNWGNRISGKRKLYSLVYNTRLKFSGLSKTDYFCEINDVDDNLLAKNTTMEIMVHPRLNENGDVTNYDNGVLLADLFNKKISSGNIMPY